MTKKKSGVKGLVDKVIHPGQTDQDDLIDAEEEMHDELASESASGADEQAEVETRPADNMTGHKKFDKFS